MDNSISVFLFRCGEFYSSVRAYPMARYSFRLAANRGHVPSMRELGMLLIQGKGGEVDIYEGSTLLHRAEASGDVTASIALDSYLEF